ncbi:dnaJ homolog subfamily C member 25 homolog [Mytilus californianus]|uniref:dnaJ homolog subfamily C member 25 homolog n=1 Tax=Mytilus californianus TaxID=6549 RepID=UPI0022481A9D|nr:dnaJ homolog subfamily C member 25 homolog [Mytilus californianus]
MANRFAFLLILSVIQVDVCFSFMAGLYCGLDNCYEILGVTRDATKTEITKGYRKLARKWHPDMHKTEKKKEEATEKFREIGNAYEILKDEDQRSDYDYMLDHPDEFFANYYNYYKRRYAPKVDPRIVIGVTITVISFIQYWGAWNNYNSALDYACKEAKYRHRAMDIAQSEGLVTGGKNNRKKDKRSKEEIKSEEEAVIRKVIEDKIHIHGGYGKPTVYDILWVQIVFLPYYLLQYICWWCRWIWKFTICRNEYGEEEKLHLIRKFMKLATAQFDALEDHEREEFLRKELWKKDNFTKWKKNKEDEQKAKLAESGRYKSYRRYMKSGGPGQMTFGPE